MLVGTSKSSTENTNPKFHITSEVPVEVYTEFCP